MKNYHIQKYLFIAILVTSLFNSSVYAQLEWKWAKKGTNIYSTWGNGTECWTNAADKLGNVYQTLINEQWGAYSIDTFHFSNPRHGIQLIVTKCDSTGTFKWGMATGDSTNASMPLSHCVDAAGNSYILGVYSSTVFQLQSARLTNPGPGNLCFLTKVSPDGHVLWARNVCQNSYQSQGGIGVDDSGNIYIARQFDSPIVALGSFTLHNTDATGATSDMFLAKYDSTGNCKWAKRFGGNRTEYADALVVTGDGNIYLAGRFQSDSLSIGSFNLPLGAAVGYRVSFIAKFDRNGNPLFANRISPHVAINSMAADRFQNLYTTGAIDWTVILGTDTLVCTGLQNVFFAKYNSLGNMIWAKRAGGTNYDAGFWIAVDNCDRVWLSGGVGGFGYVPGSSYSTNFWGTILNAPPSSYDPMFIVECDSSGNLLNTMTMPSGGDDRCAIALDNAGNAYFSGDYWRTTMAFGQDTLHADSTFEQFFVARYQYDTTVCDCSTIPMSSFTHTGYGSVNFTYTGSTSYDSLVWNFGDGTTSHTVNPTHSFSMGAFNVCVTVYSHCATGGSVTYCDTIWVYESVKDPVSVEDINFSPNPAANTTTLHSLKPLAANSKLELFDLTGRCINSYPLNGTSSTISLGELSSGVYQCRIVSGNSVIWKKLVVTR